MGKTGNIAHLAIILVCWLNYMLRI